jgi:hypothetical protein
LPAIAECCERVTAVCEISTMSQSAFKQIPVIPYVFGVSQNPTTKYFKGKRNTYMHLFNISVTHLAPISPCQLIILTDET